MTIDELLQAAGEACQAALAVMSIDDPMECAQVAQACATCAQAMDNHRFVEQWTKLSSTTTVYNDPTEAAEAAIYDANIAQWREEEEQEQA